MMNDQLGLNPFDRPALVQTKKKYATFTVKEIGGPKEIIEWRRLQAEKEARNQTIRMQLVESQKDKMFGPDAPVGDGVTWKGSASVTTSSWKDKLEFALEERKRLAKIDEDYTPSFKWEITPEPKLTVWQKVKRVLKDIWDSAQEK